MADGLDALTGGEGRGCLCFIPSEGGRKVDETELSVAELVQ
jgi:hypothetical protein